MERLKDIGEWDGRTVILEFTDMTGQWHSMITMLENTLSFYRIEWMTRFS